MQDFSRILIFCPHPDDVELFMGGTFLKHVREGAAVRVVMMTCGEKASLLSLLGPRRMEAVRQTRLAEIRSRFALVPSVELVLLNLPDRDVRKTDDTVARAAQEVSQFLPTCVYLPESVKTQTFYLHPDHLATGQIAEAAAGHRAGTLFRYLHSKAANTLVDVSAFHRENLTALRCYRSQYSWHTGIPFLLRHYEIVRYFRTRGHGKAAGCRFAEAFREPEAGSGVRA